MEKREGAKAPSKRTPIDWDDAARLLAVGLTPVEVAQLVGTTPGRINARIKRVRSFREAIEQHRSAGRASPREAYERFCKLVYAHLERQVRSGNLKVLMWIADRMKLVRPPDVDAPELELQRLLRTLSEEQRAEIRALGEE